MTVYVTQLQRAGYHGRNAGQALKVGSKFGHYWCLLFADGADSPELHAAAARLRVHTKWFDHNHYEITPQQKTKAVAAGACPLSPRAADEIFARQRRSARRKAT